MFGYNFGIFRLFLCIWTFVELIVENNPYEGHFTDQQLKRLAEFIDVGASADAVELGLDSKFQLECVNKHLLRKCGLVLLKVRVVDAS